MELIINISEDIHGSIKNNIEELKDEHTPTLNALFNAIFNGTPLPKGHGRLIDADELEECKEIMDTISGESKYAVRMDDVKTAQTIVEADTIKVKVKHDVLTKDDIKDPDPEDNVFVDAAESIKQTIALVKEDQEKFIFEAIVPFLAEINEIVIPKRVLERALFTFKEEHTAEWKALMKEYGGTDIYDLY